MRIRGFVKAVAELLGDRVPSYRRHPRRLGAMGLDLSRTEIQSLEQRLVLAAPMLGAEISTYELSTVFGANGRDGESVALDGVLYVPGNINLSPVVSLLNLEDGISETLFLEKVGSASGIFKKDGKIFFIGLSVGADRGYDVTYWEKTGRANVISDVNSSTANSVSDLGRMVLAIHDSIAGYADVGEDILHNLPGVFGFKIGANSITSDNRYIGAGGFNSARDKIGLVYELNPVSGQYQILKTDYKSSLGEDVTLMILHETSSQVVGLAYFLNMETYSRDTTILGLDGEVLAEVSDVAMGAVAVGDKFFVATQGVEGRIAAFNKTWEQKEYTASQIFGVSGIEFQAGSLAATEDGKLVVIGTRVSDGKVFVKTFEVPQDATLPQVDGSSIVVPELVAGGAGTISWAPVAGATGYDLAFSQNGVVARTASVTTASYAVPASFRAGSYTLTIRATAGERLGPLSSEVAVVVKPQAVVRTTLTGLPVLANSASVIRWQAVPDASSYSVTVRQVSAPANAAPVFSGTTQTNSISLPTGLAANVYELTIVARSGVILSPETKTTFTVRSSDPPLAPVMVPIPATITDSTPTFAWSAPEDAVSYNLWLTNRDTRTRTLYQTGLTGTSFDVPTAISPARYAVWVQAVNASGQTSSWSPLTEFDLLAPAVVLTSGSGQSFDGRPKLVWSAVPNATSYEIRITPVGSVTSLVSVTGVTGTTFTPTSPIPAGRYVITLRAFRGTRVFSVWSSGDPLLVRSGPLGLQRIGSQVSGSAGFSWQSVPGAVSYSYEIRRAVTGSAAPGSVVATGSQAGTSATPATPLAPGRYSARVYATFTGGVSTQWSIPLAFEVFHAPVTITSSSAATADATPTITWTAATGAASYEIFVGRVGSSAAVYSLTGITGTTHRVATPLLAGSHQIWVRANFADGSRSLWSAPQSLLIGPAPVINRNGSSISWNAINGATHYEFWLDYVGPNSPVRKIVYSSTLFTTSAALPASLPRGRYQLWVRAIRAEAGVLSPGLWGTTGVFELT